MSLFPKLSENELRELVKNELIRLLQNVKEGRITWADFYYRLLAEQSLSYEEKKEILKNPTIATIKRVFGEEVEELSINDLKFKPPAVVVVPNTGLATKLVNQYAYFSPLVSYKDVPDVPVVNIYKAITLTVKKYEFLRDKGYSYVIYGRYYNKAFEGLKALVVMLRAGKIPIVSERPIMLDVEKDMIENARVLSVSDTVVEVIDTKISREFQPAVREFAERYKLEREFKDIGIHVVEFEHRPDWYNYGFDSNKPDPDILTKALQEGFSGYVAKKIAMYKVENISDIVKLVKELKYYYRDERYWREKVIPSISRIFNYRPDLIEKLVELL